MKKIIFIVSIILFGLVNPNFKFKSLTIEFLAPFIEFNREIYERSSNLFYAFSDINSLRNENFILKNKEFVYVSKDYKERISELQVDEVNKIKLTVAEDSFFTGKNLEIVEILFLDKVKSKVVVKKSGEFKIGDVALLGRYYLGLIVAVNSTTYEIDLWNNSQESVNAHLISNNNEKLVVSVRSENYNTSFIENILSTEKVGIGDLVVTSTTNRGIPANLYLGIVDRVEGISSQTFRKALIRKQYDLDKSNYILLMKND